MGPDTAERSAVSFEAKFYVRRSLWNLIYGGIFDRFPRLRLIMTEEGLDWLLPTLRQLDWHVQRNSDERVVHGKVWGDAARRLKLRPTEYLQRNCYITASGEFHHRAMATRDPDIPIDHVMWGADYPHDEGTHPYTREALRAVFADVPTQECRMVLGLNAAELYGFDLDVLRPMAERIGPSVDELHTPLDAYPDGSTLELFLGKLGEPGTVGAL
jgi:predicted TIM-barrel fold metal-dependent hydrolase